MRGGDRALGRQPPVSHPHTHESVHKTMNSAWETKEGLPGALGEQLAGQGAGGAGLDLKRPDPERPSKEGDWGRRLQRPGHPSGLLVPPKFRIDPGGHLGVKLVRETALFKYTSELVETFLQGALSSYFAVLSAALRGLGKGLEGCPSGNEGPTVRGPPGSQRTSSCSKGGRGQDVNLGGGPR